jgi:hypothetical protein
VSQPHGPVAVIEPRPAPVAATAQSEANPSSPAPSSDAAFIATTLAATLSQSLEARSPSRPLAAALAAAAASIGEPDRVFDVAAFVGLTEEESRVALSFHAACAALGRDLAAGKSAGELATSMNAVVAALEHQKPLSIGRAEFATRVDGFGRLAPIEQRRFLPGRSTQVIVYTEVDGFRSERSDDATVPSSADRPSERGGWVTTLATRLAIFAKHDGTEVWSRDWQAVTDVSAVRREDFFICEKVTLSEFLSVGTYVLKSTVRDERSGAIAERSIEFSIVADPSLAAR